MHDQPNRAVCTVAYAQQECPPCSIDPWLAQAAPATHSVLLDMPSSVAAQDFTLPDNVTATTSMAEAIADAQFAVHAVPVQHSRRFLDSIKVWKQATRNLQESMFTIRHAICGARGAGCSAAVASWTARCGTVLCGFGAFAECLLWKSTGSPQRRAPLDCAEDAAATPLEAQGLLVASPSCGALGSGGQRWLLKPSLRG